MMLPFSIAAYVVASGINGFFQTVKEKNCSDPQTNSTIVDLSASLQDVVEKNLTAMIMTVFIFVLEIFLWIKSNMVSKKQKEKMKIKQTAKTTPIEERPAEATPAEADPEGVVVEDTAAEKLRKYKEALAAQQGNSEGNNEAEPQTEEAEDPAAEKLRKYKE